MKTLNTIQTLSKIGKIFSKIINICCIIGLVGCGVGSVAMLVCTEASKVEGGSLNELFNAEAGVSVGTVWTAIVVGTILCVGEFFLSRTAQCYFANELKAGPPFTTEGAKELMHLGISAIWIPVVTGFLASVAREVTAQFAENAEKISVDAFDGVGLGVAIIVISLLCKYGAETMKQ